MSKVERGGDSGGDMEEEQAEGRREPSSPEATREQRVGQSLREAEREADGGSSLAPRTGATVSAPYWGGEPLSWVRERTGKGMETESRHSFKEWN